MENVLLRSSNLLGLEEPSDPFYVISKGLFSLVAFFACFRALIEYIYQKVVYLLTW